MPPTSPLVARFPQLGHLARADLGVQESAVELHRLPDDVELWCKRDDRNAPILAGNKVRALEFLLGGVAAGTGVLTVGGVGSTHVLATAVHAGRVGAWTRAYRWPHEHNSVTGPIAEAIEATCAAAPVLATPAHAMVAAWWHRVRHNERWIPFGGTSPLGMLGHVNAGFELAGQVESGMLPAPAAVVVPLGSGGTAAGLALGFAWAGLGTEVVAVRCGPTIGQEALWLRWLRERARRLVVRCGVPERELSGMGRIRMEHGAYAGAYARPLPAAAEVSAAMAAASGATLDATYSAKACYAAWRLARAGTAPVLFWHTFDARWLTAGVPAPVRPGHT